MRLVGVDWGSARIGIAVGELEFGIATARSPIAASGALKKDAIAIGDLAKREEAEQIVVGIPFQDHDDRAARVCFQLVERLKELGWTVHPVNESLTTVASHADLAEEGLTAAQRRRVVDGESARRILLRYFEEHGN